MRESVRHFKPTFYQSLREKNKQLIILLSYHSKQMYELEQVDAAVVELLQKLPKV
jgi:hypothetical protein